MSERSRGDRVVATVRSLLLTRNFLPVLLLVAATLSLAFYAATRASLPALGLAVALGGVTQWAFGEDLRTLRLVVAGHPDQRD